MDRIAGEGGMMEWWNDGMVEEWKPTQTKPLFFASGIESVVHSLSLSVRDAHLPSPNIPSFQHSRIPSFQYSTIPLFHEIPLQESEKP